MISRPADSEIESQNAEARAVQKDNYSEKHREDSRSNNDPRAGKQRRPNNQPRRDRRDIHGWIVLDKPIGMTSTQAVAVVKRLFQAKRAGHAGKPETCCGERAEPVGQDAAEHVPDRGGAAEHQQREADLRRIKSKTAQRDREIGEHCEAAERP